MKITHPLTAPAPIVVLANVLRRFLRPRARRFTAHLGCQVSALVAKSQAAVKPRFDSDLFTAHADAKAALRNLESLATKLQRVIVADGALLNVAQNGRQVVLGTQWPVCIGGIVWGNREAPLPFRQELAFQIRIGLFQRIRAAQP